MPRQQDRFMELHLKLTRIALMAKNISIYNTNQKSKKIIIIKKHWIKNARLNVDMFYLQLFELVL